MLCRVHAVAQEGKWITVSSLDVDRNSPIGQPIKTTVDGRSEIEETHLIEESLNGINIPVAPWLKKGTKWGMRLGPNLADQLTHLVYRTDYETIQVYQEYKAVLRVWDENASTGEVRGVGVRQTTAIEPVGDPYEVMVGRYLTESKWSFER